MFKSLAAITSRFRAHIHFATAKVLVPVAVAGLILFGSQIVLAAAPTADFGFSPSVGRVGQPVSFTAMASDEDDDIVSVDWDFENDGSVDASGTDVQHTYSSSGSRTVRMTVTDATNETAVVDHTIRVNSPPNAAFQHSPSSPTIGESVRFDASGSTDDAALSDGGFAWDLDNDGAYDDAAGREVDHSFLIPGANTVRLQVTDSDGEQSTTSDSVVVGPANTAPNAAFTFTPQRPNPNQSVAFNAGGTTDDGPLLPTAYAWDLDGDGQFDDALGITPATSYASGTRVVSLRVTDPLGASDTASQTVTVNAPPSASFTFLPARPNVAQSVAFDASATTDDGTIANANFAWDFDGNGSTDATGRLVNHPFPSPGARTVTLRVTDADGALVTTSLSLTVNAPPVVDFTFTPTAPLKGQQVRFTATATDDVALPATAYAWDLDNDSQFDDGTTAQVTTSYADAGAKVVRLRVTDSGNVPTTVTKTVNVNTAPTADFTLEPQTPRLNEPVKFTSTSTDPDAGQTITGYAWDLDGDGQFDDSTAAGPTSAYTSEGEKVVRLRVTDSAGATSVRERRFVVADKIPEAAFRFSPAAPVPGQTITFTSTSVASPGSTISKIEWNLDAISGFVRQGSAVTYAFPTAGVHTVQIKVTENSGGVDIATADIVVNAPPTALISFSPAQPYTDDVVRFASLARDPDGYLASETWDLDGDGQYDDAAGKLASRAFTTVGARTVRLRVVDGSGAAAVQAVRLNVRARPVVAPPPPEQLDPTVRITSRPGKRLTVITRLGIRAEKGAMVKAVCTGKSCPRPRASSARSRGKAMRLRRLERRLRPGTRIRIYVTAKGKIGSYTSLLIRRSKHPSRRDLCLRLGTTRAIQCPS